MMLLETWAGGVMWSAFRLLVLHVKPSGVMKELLQVDMCNGRDGSCRLPLLTIPDVFKDSHHLVVVRQV